MWNTKPRIDSPAKASWFEFLLDPSLLVKHLDQDNPDPSATELIINFLSNVSGVKNEQTNGVNTNTNGNKMPVFGPPNICDENFSDVIEIKDEPENKKKLALKLLALKIAAYLKWDLTLLKKKLPLNMQQALLWELLKITGHDIKEKNFLSKNGIHKLSPDAVFARILYCIWVLQTVIEDCYTSKNSKGMSVQIPGQVDPMVVAQVVIDSIVRRLNDEAGSATSTLETYVQGPCIVRMPLLICFDYVPDENACPRWEQGLVLSREEIICQVSYTLGRYYFFQEEFEDSNKHLKRTSDLYQQYQHFSFCQLDTAKLQGFYHACGRLIGNSGYESTSPVSLKESLQKSITMNHDNTVSILRTDNIKRELNIPLRDEVEISVLENFSNNQDLTKNVSFLNLLRRVMEGTVVIFNWKTLLKLNEEKSAIMLCDMIKEALIISSPRQKLFLDNFIRVLCLTSINAKNLLKKFSMLSRAEDEELDRYLKVPVHKKDSIKPEKIFKNDTSIQLGLLERRLLSTAEPAVIKLLVTQLRSKFGVSNISSLNKQWELPPYIRIFFNSIPHHVIEFVDVDLVQILIAKSNELRAMKKYDDAKLIWNRVDLEIRNHIPRLLIFLNWEILNLDLLEILEAPVYICQSSTFRTDIVQRILQFMSWIKDHPDSPETHLLELCAAVLLNFREWDKIIEQGLGMGSYFEFSRLVALICRDVFLNKGNRSNAKDLWNAILPMFFNPNAQKRMSSGIIKDINYDHLVQPPIMNKSALQFFIKKLKDTSSLGVIISCLAQFYNILKDDSMGEIFLEYNGLWPATISNPSGFNMTAVGDAFQNALYHALTIHPTHSAWLRTKGDVFYVQGSYATALKYFISAAMVCTDYFYQSLPKVLFDDMMLKHMINCCTKLFNFTQSAVLYQFLEEPNYQGAFKALTERACNDSCDTYYNCIWDVTLLEFLIYLHSKRSEFDYRHLALQVVGQLELNANNNEEIQREAANLRRGKFLRAMAKQYL